MPLSQMPFLYYASDDLQRRLGRDLPVAAAAAVRTLLLRRKSVEVACLQLEYKGAPIVFSSRIGKQGDIILEMEMGDPRLALREVEEDQLRDAELDMREKLRVEPRQRRGRKV